MADCPLSLLAFAFTVGVGHGCVWKNQVEKPFESPEFKFDSTKEFIASENIINFEQAILVFAVNVSSK